MTPTETVTVRIPRALAERYAASPSGHNWHLVAGCREALADPVANREIRATVAQTGRATFRGEGFEDETAG